MDIGFAKSPGGDGRILRHFRGLDYDARWYNLPARRISLRRVSSTVCMERCELHEGGIYLKSRPAHIFGKFERPLSSTL